jgi:hypothetical protein
MNDPMESIREMKRVQAEFERSVNAVLDAANEWEQKRDSRSRVSDLADAVRDWRAAAALLIDTQRKMMGG